MRKYTLLVSVLAHAGALAVLLLAPLFAAEILPQLRDRTEWMPVVAVVPPPVPPPPSPAPIAPKPSLDAAPVKAPDGIQPEADIPSSAAGPPSLDDIGGVSGGHFVGVPFSAGDDGLDAPPEPAVRMPTAPLRVGGAVQRPVKIVDVAPIYPTLAVRTQTEGGVVLEAIIGEDGSVRELRVLRSIALLDEAAITAVKQWRFSPTRLNGEPVPVLMTVTVNFRLNR
jgi:protein TonB